MNDYPPLTSLDVMPLHAGADDYPPPCYIACTEPERPRCGETLYDWRCPGCVLAAEVGVVTQGDSEMWWHPTLGAEPQRVSLAWMVARSRYHGIGEVPRG